MIVYCLQRDKLIIKEILKVCVQRYEDITEKTMGRRVTAELSINEEEFLKEKQLQDLSDVSIDQIK